MVMCGRGPFCVRVEDLCQSGGDPYRVLCGCRPGQFSLFIGYMVFTVRLISVGLLTFVPDGWYPRWCPRGARWGLPVACG